MQAGPAILNQFETSKSITTDEQTITQMLDTGCVGYICSYPYPGTDFSRAEIDKLTLQLKDILDKEGYAYRKGGGVYKGVVNTDSFMVFNITKERLIELGRQFKQDSVIYTEQNQHQCIYLQCEKEGVYCTGQGWQKLASDTNDNYCLVILNDGAMLKFNTHIDWANEHKLEKVKLGI